MLLSICVIKYIKMLLSILSIGITLMSQEKRLDQWMSNQFWKFDVMIGNGANFFRWSETKLNI